MSANLVCEKDIVLEVVKFLHKELKKRGYSVLLTRDKDIYIDLVARTELANKKARIYSSQCMPIPSLNAPPLTLMA